VKEEKLIICAAPTSSLHGKDVNPALPYSPEEVAEETYKCWNEGASVVHIHARDHQGNPTCEPVIFREIDGRIREKGCDIIIQHSTSSVVHFENQPGKMVDVDEGAKAIETNPEMCSLNTHLGCMLLRGLEIPMIWTRSWIEKHAKIMLDRGIKPEIEVYSPGNMEEVYNLVDKNLLVKPYWISFVFGMNRVNQGTVRHTPKNLMHYIDLLPEGAMFTVLGIAQSELQVAVQSILLGGHVRIGFEDNVYYKKGVLAESSAQNIARVVRISRELGREIATPDEARKILGIRKYEP